MSDINDNKRILDDLSNESLIVRMQAVRNLYKIDYKISLKVIHDILKLDTNLGMKLEALMQLPIILNSTNLSAITSIIESAIDDQDPEIMRTGLNCIMKIPPDFIKDSLLNKIIDKLNFNDTDVQYLGIKLLIYLKDRLTKKRFIEVISPLKDHSNKTLSTEAERAISLI